MIKNVIDEKIQKYMLINFKRRKKIGFKLAIFEISVKVKYILTLRILTYCKGIFYNMVYSILLNYRINAQLVKLH